MWEFSSKVATRVLYRSLFVKDVRTLQRIVSKGRNSFQCGFSGIVVY